MHRLQHAARTAELLNRDLSLLGVTQRQAAQVIGIGKSTFNDFLNARATTRGNQKRVIRKLLACEAWADDTRQALEILLHYDELALRNKLRLQPQRHAAE